MVASTHAESWGVSLVAAPGYGVPMSRSADGSALEPAGNDATAGVHAAAASSSTIRRWLCMAERPTYDPAKTMSITPPFYCCHTGLDHSIVLRVLHAVVYRVPELTNPGRE